MDGIFDSRRRMCGVGTLVAAVVLTGAWIKSVVDRAPAAETIANEEDLLPLSGRLGISVSSLETEWVGHRPQVCWDVLGLFRNVEIRIAPEQVVPRPLDPARCTGSATDELETPAPSAAPAAVVDFTGDVEIPEMISEADDVTDGQLLPPVRIQPVARRVTAPPADAESGTPIGVPVPRTGLVTNTTANESGKVTSRRELCGFCLARSESADGSWDWAVLIPHWSIVVPLYLLSSTLLMKPRRGAVETAHIAVTAPGRDRATGIEMIEPANKCGRPLQEKWGMLTPVMSLALREGWRGRVTLATLVVWLALIAGWVRSSFVSDVVELVPPIATNFRAASAKDGLAWQHGDGLIPFRNTSGIHYLALYGRAHATLYFLPEDFDALVEASGLADGFIIPDASSEETPAMRPLFPQRPSGEFNPRCFAGPTTASGVTEWAGAELQWGGLYMERD
ncbi:MAG TPA: hypothetical protein VL475_02660, partial [Planctomycetaceae bacterium]|nr:hypothetical protein [Planctomycetaceae bacterium]